MAIGDDAIAAGYTPAAGTVAANTIDTEMARLADWVAQRTSAVLAVLKGGTGATTAAAARANLGVTESAAAGVVDVNKGAVYSAAGLLVSNTPTAPGHVANKGYTDAAVASGTLGFFYASGGTISGSVTVTGNETVNGNLGVDGQIFLPNSYAAVSGFTIAYINSDGRVSRGTSSRRWKKFISAIIPSSLGNLFPTFQRFQMKSLDGTGDGKWHYGYIAEDLADNPATEPFVVYGDDGLPLSYDMIGLLLAQNAQLHERLVALESA